MTGEDTLCQRLRRRLTELREDSAEAESAWRAIEERRAALEALSQKDFLHRRWLAKGDEERAAQWLAEIRQTEEELGFRDRSESGVA